MKDDNINWKGNPALKPLLVPIESVMPDDTNAWEHPQFQINMLIASLEQFGQRYPIVLNPEGTMSKAGSGTLIAAGQCAWTHIAVARSDLSPAQLQAFGLTDNEIQNMNSWDIPRLLAFSEATPVKMTHYLLDPVSIMGGHAPQPQGMASVPEKPPKTKVNFKFEFSNEEELKIMEKIINNYLNTAGYYTVVSRKRPPRGKKPKG